MQLTDRTILITGGARRIGRALTLALASEGANLIIHYSRSSTEAESLQKILHDQGARFQFIQSDFSSQAAIEEFLETVFKTGLVDSVINNASIFSDLDWESTTTADWNLHQQINLTAPFLISQAFARKLPDGIKGRIINLLDWRALRPGSDHLPYTISKAGLASLTKSLAIGLAPNITVNGLALGAILPPSDGGVTDDLVSSLPIPRWAELHEVEDTVIFLLTGPEYITGEIIHLDGGRHLI
jgi:NAD(P)-dependent dehydrogenase (short-subunit alcohol dehydrogenase family)